MTNQIYSLCIQETINTDGKILPSGLIFKITSMPSDDGTNLYFVSLDGEDMGIITADQFRDNFWKTSLTLAEYRLMDSDQGVVVWC